MQRKCVPACDFAWFMCIHMCVCVHVCACEHTFVCGQTCVFVFSHIVGSCKCTKSKRWTHEYQYCGSCGDTLLAGGNTCPVCARVYGRDEDIPMTECNQCLRWVHAECDTLDQRAYETLGESGVEYWCPPCRKLARSAPPLSASRVQSEQLMRLLGRPVDEPVSTPAPAGKRHCTLFRACARTRNIRTYPHETRTYIFFRVQSEQLMRLLGPPHLHIPVLTDTHTTLRAHTHKHTHSHPSS